MRFLILKVVLKKENMSLNCKKKLKLHNLRPKTYMLIIVVLIKIRILLVNFKKSILRTNIYSSIFIYSYYTNDLYIKSYLK